MSVVKSNAHQVGQSVTASQNMTWYQPSTPDGTVRLGVGNAGATTGDVITATSAGVTVPSMSSANTFGFKNRIINGGMVIDQRNAGASITPTTDAFTVDRWRFQTTQSSKLSFQQNAGSVTPPVGYTNYLGATSLSAYSISSSDIFVLGQQIEGYNIADLAWGTASAKTVTLSFWVRCSQTGTFGGVLRNGAADRSYPFTYTVSSANTWEQKTVTVAGDTTGTWATDNGKGLQILFGLGCGSTYSGTAGSWAGAQYWSATGATSVVGTNGATFYITGVQLEVGSAATSFDFRSYGTELGLCQRYYWKNLYTTGGAPTLMASLIGYTTTNIGQGYSKLPVTMRASPTSTISGTLSWWNGSGSGPITSIAATNNTPDIGVLNFTAAGGGLSSGAAYNVIVISATNQYIDFSAEL